MDLFERLGAAGCLIISDQRRGGEIRVERWLRAIASAGVELGFIGPAKVTGSALKNVAETGLLELLGSLKESEQLRESLGEAGLEPLAGSPALRI